MSWPGRLSPPPAALCGSLAPLRDRSRTDSALIQPLQPTQLARLSLAMAVPVPGPCPFPSGPCDSQALGAEASPAPRSPPKTCPLGLTAHTAHFSIPKGAVTRRCFQRQVSASLGRWVPGRGLRGKDVRAAASGVHSRTGLTLLESRHFSGRLHASLKHQLWEMQEREMTASRTFSGKACALVWRGGFSEQVAFRLRPDGQMSFGGLQPKVGTF